MATDAPPAPPRRRPVGGGYSRGEATRTRIIEAALKVFSEKDFIRATTREIAAEAGVPPPALQYYFDSKEGLHRACGEYLLERVTAAFEPDLEAARQTLAAGRPETAREGVCALLDAMIMMFLASERSPAWRRFMAGSLTDSARPAFAIMQQGITDRVFNLCGALAAQALGRDPDDEEAKLMGSLLITQLYAFGVHRDHTLQTLGWKDLSERQIVALRAALRRIALGALADSP